MKKLTLSLFFLLSFASFGSSQFAMISGSCWKCTGGSFKTGQIECTPEATARLYEVNMNYCQGDITTHARNNYYQAPQQNSSLDEINQINQEIENLKRKLSRLKKQNNL